MLEISMIQEQLKDRNLKYIGEKIGLSYPTMLTLAGGKQRDYSFRVLNAVSKYLECGASAICKRRDDEQNNNQNT